MKITRRQLRRIIRESIATDSGPMSPEEQQEEFDRLVDSGSEPTDLKATGKYPDVDSLDSDVARRYFERKLQ